MVSDVDATAKVEQISKAVTNPTAYFGCMELGLWNGNSVSIWYFENATHIEFYC